MTGKVTLDGQPLENADVTFQPDDGKPPSIARTNKDGEYELAFGRGKTGAIVGPHTVRISISPDVAPNAPNIPARYNTESGEHREVKTGRNEFNFDLTTGTK